MNLLYTAHVPAGEGPFPAVLALHGWGASAHDLIGLSQVIHSGGALVLCPQGSVSTPIGPGMEGYGWFPLTRGAPAAPAEIERGADDIDAFIDAALVRYPIRPDRLLLLGFSQGGVMAYRLFLERPERFAGMVALSSWLPADLADRLPETKEPIDRPVLVLHGTRDPMIDVERARESRKRLLHRKLPLSYREYEMGHEIGREALAYLVEWIEDKVFTPVRLL